jgi:hypothetical protein
MLLNSFFNHTRIPNAKAHKTFRARSSAGASPIGVDKGARSRHHRVPGDGYLKQQRENRRGNGFGRPEPFSASLFSRGSNPDLRSDLAARQGFWRQVCWVTRRRVLFDLRYDGFVGLGASSRPAGAGEGFFNHHDLRFC